MRNKPFLRLIVLSLGIGLGASVFYLSALAQSAEREKPKLKNFGSSLKRIKWDANKNAAIEIKTNKEHDGKRRKITIGVKGHPEYVLMGRKSYYAPDAEQ